VITRPTGSFATGGGGGGGLAGVAAGLLSPGDLDLPQAGVAWVRLDLSVDTAHDRMELGLYHDSRLATTEPGSTLTIALGDDGDNTDVLTAEVAGLVDDAAAPVLVGYVPSRRLSFHRVARSYVRQTVAEVVSDLLADGEVDEGDLDAPQALAAYHVDPTRPVWGHLHALARLVGAQITTRPDGALSFGPAAGPAAPEELRSGAHVIERRRGAVAAEETPAPAVARLGAASGQGPSRWYHLVKEPDSSGDVVVVSPTVRDQDLADVATTARVDAARRRRHSARLRVVGDPALRAGAEVTVDDTPWRALRVRHLLSADAGYVCDLVLEGT
jgi:hypothetical protein